MRPSPPPGDLALQPLPLHLHSVETYRLWQKHHSSAFFWSKKGIYRFDSKSARYGVLYTAGSIEGAMLEVFGDQWVKRRVLSRALLANYQISVIADPQISVFTAPRTLKLVNTTADNLNKLGVDSMLFSSINYRLTRVWARAFMKHPSCPQGILYHSRKNPLLLNFAFFGTSEVKNLLAEVDVGPLETISSFNEILDRYEVSLV